MTPPNEAITRQIDDLLKSGYRPTVDHVALLMGAVVRDAPLAGYVEYVKPDTGLTVGCVPRDPRR